MGQSIKDFYQKHINKWKSSGLKQTEYCQLNKVKLPAFRKWKTTLSKQTEALTEVPMKISTDQKYRVFFDKKWEVEIPANFSSETLIRLFKTIQESC